MHVAAGFGMLRSMKPVRPDRLRDVVDAVLEALDEGLDGPRWQPGRCSVRFHFNRLVRAGIGEAPACSGVACCSNAPHGD